MYDMDNVGQCSTMYYYMYVVLVSSTTTIECMLHTNKEVYEVNNIYVMSTYIYVLLLVHTYY